MLVWSGTPSGTVWSSPDSARIFPVKRPAVCALRLVSRSLFCVRRSMPLRRVVTVALPATGCPVSGSVAKVGQVPVHGLLFQASAAGYSTLRSPGAPPVESVSNLQNAI